MDYKNGKIYKIVSDHTDKIYIGSTCQPLNKRIGQHRANYKRYQEGKSMVITTSFEIMKLGNYHIVLIENVQCNNREELFAKERHHIDLFKNICVNKFMPTRTPKEYLEDNKEKIKERISKIINCCCGSHFQKGKITRHNKSNKHIKFLESQTNNIKV